MAGLPAHGGSEEDSVFGYGVGSLHAGSFEAEGDGFIQAEAGAQATGLDSVFR